MESRKKPMITSIKKHLAEVPYNINLAAPVILGMLGHTLVAFADNIMVGRLGPAELAAVSLGNSFLFIAMSVGLGLSTAITPLIAEADGFKKQFEIKKVFKHGVLICTVVGLVLTGVVFLSVPLLYQMQQPEEVLVFAVPFLTIVGVSLIPLMLFQAIKQLCDGLSRTRLPMYASIIGNLLNVLLNYLLIFGNFGFPEMGVAGGRLRHLDFTTGHAVAADRVLEGLPIFCSFTCGSQMECSQLEILKTHSGFGITLFVSSFL